ncbi:MAG TPA: hypothetical protein VFX48_09785 [Saprospiraceae bacterium]|nr:hypothetical protein [Saprospiraceae bacterium]
MKCVFGLVMAVLLSGCAAHRWSGIDCPDFKKSPRQGFADFLGWNHWAYRETSQGNRVRYPVKEQKALSLQMEMENLELLQSGIQFSRERMSISNPVKAVLGWKPAVSENVKTNKIIHVKKFFRNIRGQTDIRPGGMSSETAAQDKRQIPFATVLGILSLGFSGLGWLLLLSSGGFAVLLGLIGGLGGCISILVGLYGLNKEWKKAARWAIILGILAILLNPITFFIATYGA